jgi:hypothetical protein
MDPEEIKIQCIPPYGVTMIGGLQKYKNNEESA